ncbi:MAG TPA: hypothetical protein VKT82_08425 [Ktedonobacterales bacterium]|nr:hypothetical protein [Ktedonobacterales bacterium]
MDPALRLHPDQQELTSAQEAEARRFAEERIQAQLSTEPVDEQEAEALLRQAYEVAGLAAPQRIQWVDGPLQLVAALAPRSVGESITASSWGESVRACMFRNGLGDIVEASVHTSVDTWLWNGVMSSVSDRVRDRVASSVGFPVRNGAYASVSWVDLLDSIRDHVWGSIEASVRAYTESYYLAFSRLFDVYLAPNDLHALALFNELVSGYWLGQEEAIIVRRPKILSRDAEGRLHSATGPCIEYPDGWGFYAWHGVVVPERVILAPETLTRDDFLNESNVEVRRVMQEQMGERFVPELGGVVIDHSPRGTLYEVRLPDGDPERVARYVQVLDASTARQYFLRVPPTIQTAAEAVAWTFQVGVEDYHPSQET